MSLETIAFKFWVQSDMWYWKPHLSRLKVIYATSWTIGFLFLEIHIVTLNRNEIDKLVPLFNDEKKGD